MADLWGVLVGGIIGIASGAVLEWIKQRYEKRKRQEDHLIESKKREEDKLAALQKERKERLVELIEALYKHNDWIVILTRISLSNTPELEPPSALAKVSAITRVYFPEFEKTLAQLSVATQEYEFWLKDKNRDTDQREPLFIGYQLALQSFFSTTMAYGNEKFK